MTIEINGVPAPHGTCAVSLADNGQIVLHMPGQRAEQHTVKLTPDLNGMRALVNILRKREREPRATIGMDAAPTQLMVDAWLAAHPRHEPKPPKPSPVELTPSEVDELLDGLEL